MWRRAGSRIGVLGFGLLSVCRRIATKVEQFLNAPAEAYKMPISF